MTDGTTWYVQFLDALVNDRITSIYVARATLLNMADDGLPYMALQYAVSLWFALCQYASIELTQMYVATS